MPEPSPSPNPYASLTELVAINARRTAALELIAEAVESMPDPPEAVRAIALVARRALTPPEK